ncbi:hypothetical protein LTS18_002655 [Coniosporium uncinatum]|uniref:Uncharacterized protein n=1 Tax=Coniosporium uncinatum TaxID=93489 RepID=A0ACC3DU61_9PEZI|nr:hypothetical protein LTS18_002655 [Coniosporium uncinatum]
MAETYDHNKHPVRHDRARINSLRMHYITAGTGPPLLLLHGTPKTHFYWYRLVPLLTPHFSVVAPDLRGFGATDKPPASEGYDCGTNAADMAALMTHLGHDKFHVHGEDRGAEYAYAVAGTYRERILSLSFAEMLLSGLGLDEMTFFTAENVSAQYEQRGVWNWHIPFFYLPHVPEMLIQGKEREFWEFFMRQECYDTTALEPRAVDEWIGCVKSPGGLRGVLETYRSAFKNAEVNRKLAERKLVCRIMTIGAPEFFGPLVKGQMEKVSEGVERGEVFERCGHSLALEKPERLARCLREFMLGQTVEGNA